MWTTGHGVWSAHHGVWSASQGSKVPAGHFYGQPASLEGQPRTRKGQPGFYQGHPEVSIWAKYPVINLKWLTSNLYICKMASRRILGEGMFNRKFIDIFHVLLYLWHIFVYLLIIFSCYGQISNQKCASERFSIFQRATYLNSQAILVASLYKNLALPTSTACRDA